MTSYCVFNVGDRRIGIPMTSVREILGAELIAPTTVPLVPEFVHGIFNLRGQVVPFLDLSSFVGATPQKADAESARAVIVERGDFRFATLGQRIDTVEAGEESFQPLAGAALHPALEAVAQTERGDFQVIHLDRLEACLKQALKLAEGAEPARAAAS
jgi:purine-binding chemotaxis protein CheW